MKMIYGPSTYIGMINKTSGLASGFGRYSYSPYHDDDLRKING